MNTSIKNIKQNSKVQPSKSQQKFQPRKSQETIFSLMTGKRIKTDVQVHDDIKQRRVKSYQKISFHIRKMDSMFKGQYSCQSPQNQIQSYANISEPQSPVKYRAIFNEKAQILMESPEKGKVKTGIQFYQPQSKKNNIIQRDELIPDNMLKKSYRPIKIKSQLKDTRIKTQHIEKQSNVTELQNELTTRKQSSFLHTTGKKNVLNALSNEKQEKIVVVKKSIPGIKFKLNLCAKTEETERTPFSMTNSSFFDNKSTYLHHNQLAQKDEDQRVMQMYQLRKSQHLEDFPKQWHLYNCLKLNQLSLHRTRLKISCEQWSLIDYRQLKYLRGWCPQEIGQFDISNKLFAARILLQLMKNNKIDFEKVKVKVNNSIVRRKMEDTSAILVDSNFTLNTSKNRNTVDTIISFWDLFVGMLLTKKQDLMWHLIYALCHLFKTYNLETQYKDQRIEEEPICLQNNSETLKSYDKIYLLKCKQICRQLLLKDTTLQFKRKKQNVANNQRQLWGANYSNSVFRQINQYQYLLIKSTCIDMSVLLMECLRYPVFLDLMIKAHPVYKSKVKAQIGFKYWQPRTHVWKNQYSMYNNQKFIVVVGRNDQSKQMSILSYHYQDQAIIVCNNSKLNMCLRDVTAIRDWMRQTFKRFKSLSPVKKEQSKSKQYL